MTLVHAETFSGSGLPAGWARRGVASETVSGGTLSASLTAGQGYTLQAAPILGSFTGSFMVELGVQSQINTSAPMFGPMINDSTGLGINCSWYSGSPTGLLGLPVQPTSYQYTGGFNSANSLSPTYPTRLRLRYVAASATAYYSYSSDNGASWSAETSIGRAISVSQFGFGNVCASTTAAVVINDFHVYMDAATITSAPMIQTCGVLSGQAVLSWIMPSAAESANVQFFEYRVDGGSWTTVNDTKVVISGLTNGTSYAVDVRASNPTGAGPIASKTMTPSAVTNTLVLLEDFNRADGAIGTPAIGSSWVNVVGTWGVVGNRGAITSGSSASKVTNASGAYNFDVTWRAPVQGGSTGLMFRYVDASNFWLAYSTGTSFRIYRMHAGSGFDVLNAAYGMTTVVSTDVYRIIARGRGIHVLVNGVQKGYLEDPYSATATAVGLYADSTTARFDDLILSSDTTYAGVTAEVFVDEVVPADKNDGSFLYKGRDHHGDDVGDVA